MPASPLPFTFKPQCRILPKFGLNHPIWENQVLSAPSGALYVTMSHYKPAAQPLFLFSFRPLHITVYYSVNAVHVTHAIITRYDRLYQRPQTSLFIQAGSLACFYVGLYRRKRQVKRKKKKAMC